MTTPELECELKCENENNKKITYYELNKERIKEYRKSYRQLPATKELKRLQNARYYANKCKRNKFNENEKENVIDKTT
jgi:hypothetical protein